MKKTLISITVIFLSFLFFVSLSVGAENQIDYKGELILDSDLDGLTDLGEKEIYKTDPLNPDTDSDGFYDGVEIIRNQNPLDSSVPSSTKIITNNTFPVEQETSWAWYLTRAMGIMAFVLLYLVMFLGLSIRNPLMAKLVKPIDSLNIHGWLSVQSLILAFFHGFILLFDKYLNFNIFDIFVPFYSEKYTREIALGTMGFYLMIILIITSYLRKKINYKIWRSLHFLNMALYLMVLFHALYLGSDLQSGILRNIFIYMNLPLGALILINIYSKISKKFESKNS